MYARYLSNRLSLWICFLLQVTHVVSEASPIVIKGTKFFNNETDEQFFVKGLTLQHKNYLDAIADVLTDVVECQKKISELKSLGVNVVYTYRHDAQADHSGCLKALADSNIYLLADLTSPEYRIWPGNTEWTLDLYKQYTSVVDALANFTNVLGFSVGLSSDLDADGKAQPFYKAAIRDIKRYIQDRKYRDIPVGLKAEIWMTFANNNTKLADYMSCESANPDFFGITFLQGREGGGAQCTSKEQINKMGELYKNASMPVFFSEYGCQPVDNTTQGQYTYESISALYDDETSKSLSGGILDGDFDSLGPSEQKWGALSLAFNMSTSVKAALATAKPSPIIDNSDRPRNSPNNACPSDVSFKASPTLPPSPDPILCDCMMESLRCVAKPDVIAKLTTNEFTAKLDGMCQEEDITCPDGVCDSPSCFDGKCREKNCPGLLRLGEEGKYGAFSVCNRTQQWSWAANEYWKRFGDGGCNFGESTELRGERPPPSNDCKMLLAQVGEKGEGTVTSSITRADVPVMTETGSSGTVGSICRNGACTPGSSSGLSVGAKAGIVLGVAAGVIAGLVGILFLLRRKKNQRKTAAAAAEKNNHSDKKQGYPDGAGATHAELEGADNEGLVKYRYAVEAPAGYHGTEAPVGWNGSVNVEPVEAMGGQGFVAELGSGSPLMKKGKAEAGIDKFGRECSNVYNV